MARLKFNFSQHNKNYFMPISQIQMLGKSLKNLIIHNKLVEKI